MNNKIKHPKTKLLAGALALLMAPGLAAAGDGIKSHLSDGEKDAFREGQIWATYVTNAGLDALDLQVDVKDNKAVISGTVESVIQKRLAERIAQRTDGVDRVENRIKVDPELVITVIEPVPAYATYVADATIDAMIDSKLLWNQYTDGLDINVMTEGGVVTLTGTADTPHSRTLAGELAFNTPGVTLVHNKLDLADHGGQVVTAEAADDDDVLSDTWITAKTNSTLMWTAGVQAGDIDVKTSDGVVTLTGEVDTGYERELAIDIAQNIRGVERVDASGLMLETVSETVSQR